MSKRVANKKGEHQGARSGRMRLGYWRLQRAQMRRTMELKTQRDAEAAARKAAIEAKTHKTGFLHSVAKSFNKLRSQSRRHA